ncbi:uncharacterized protein BX664DRAFT_153167 [Halteromyces radiatus]|uniref:uncharacterized protein n=1 Tax=Halteromyces radiatus TaxID=101107 RepID=UPI00221E7628|nr:uncharacterized protein BX664DRAFT_153167 [Halteromyces radiatus]KAI8086226.1 hypothetical protein BX664DRAFT_153167 [Halteromyces radiatus]
MILSTPDPNPSSSSLLRKLSTKEPSLFRNNKTRRINTSPTPSATLSRIQTFGRTWLNPFTRNSKNQSSSSSPSIEPPINIFSPSNHLSTRPILSRRRPLSHFSQDQKKPLPSSIHSKQPHRRPYSTFVTKAPLNTTSSTTSSYSSSASSTSLASKSSSSSTNVECCPCCYTPSPTFSSTTSSSSITNMTSNPQSDLEPITALDFLLDDRQQQQKQQQHQDSGHAFFQQVTEESSHNNKPKKVGTMHRISVPVRSCSSLFQQQQQQNSITSSDIKSSSISSSSSSSKQPLFTSLPSTPTGSISFQWQPQQSRKRLTSLESPLLPSRARSVFGKLDHQQKEQKAILAWRTTVTQLIQQKEECQQQEKQQQWPLSSCVTNRVISFAYKQKS